MSIDHMKPLKGKALIEARARIRKWFREYQQKKYMRLESANTPMVCFIPEQPQIETRQ